MVRSLVMLVLGLLLGVAIDGVRKLVGDGDGGYFAYRFIWVWRLFFSGLGITFYLLLYREYLRLGGELHYRAPAPWSPEKWEKLDNTPSDGISGKLLMTGIFCWDAILLLYLAVTLTLAVFAGDLRVWIFVVPAMAVAIAAWIALRISIRRRMPADGEKVYGGVLHQCALWMGAIQQLLLLIIGVMQTWMLYRSGAVWTAAYMWGIEIFILFFTIGLLWLCNRIEGTKAVENIETQSE
jgi:hypothetical protein